jgi:hypothetical protein
MGSTSADTRISVRRIAARAVSLGLTLAALWLIGFHAALFFQRLNDSSLARPGVAARWSVSVLLVAGLFIFQRFAARQRVLRSRHAVLIFWLLVAMLHVGTAADDRLLSLTSGFATVTQIGLAAAPAILLLIALFISEDRPIRLSGNANVSQIHPSKIHSACTHAPRSPPAF